MPRVALLQRLDEAARPCSASVLAASLADACDRPTVYRNLASLRDAGLVQELGRGRGQSWYVVATLPMERALFLCDACGQAVGVSARLVTSDPRWQASLAGSTAVLAGLCPCCRDPQCS